MFSFVKKRKQMNPESDELPDVNPVLQRQPERKDREQKDDDSQVVSQVPWRPQADRGHHLAPSEEEDDSSPRLPSALFIASTRY